MGCDSLATSDGGSHFRIPRCTRRCLAVLLRERVSAVSGSVRPSTSRRNFPSARCHSNCRYRSHGISRAGTCVSLLRPILRFCAPGDPMRAHLGHRARETTTILPKRKRQPSICESCRVRERRAFIPNSHQQVARRALGTESPASPRSSILLRRVRQTVVFGRREPGSFEVKLTDGRAPL